MDKYQKLLLEENEIKPNRYVARTLVFVGIITIILWIINELGIFRVDKMIMRISTVLELIFLGIPQIIAYSPRYAQAKKSKYLIVACFLCVSFIAVTCLNFHVTLILMFPLLLSSQYHNIRLSWITLIGCCFCAVACPILGLILGTWDIDYFVELLLIAGKDVSLVDAPQNMTLGKRIFEVILYIGVPEVGLLAAFGSFMFTVTRNGIANIENQLQIIRLGETDQLTQALNRNSFESNLITYPMRCRNSLSCIFMDVNGLHELNNEKGHAAGDEMLQVCARYMQDEFGNRDTYRIGGDEFVSFAVDRSEEELLANIAKIEKKLEEKGYHASIGLAHQIYNEDVDGLIKKAEKRMYEKKRDYYQRNGIDRRNER